VTINKTGTGPAIVIVAAGATLTSMGALTTTGTFNSAGPGTLEIDGAPTLNDNSHLKLTGGTLRFSANQGTATIGTGVTVTIATDATLELAGSVSALGTAGGNRVHIVNDSTAAGVVVSGTNQVVGNIDGSGTTQVNAGSDLTANHIIQGALVIDGTSKNPGLVTIDASDASGNPLGQSSGFALAGSRVHSGPFGEGVNSSASPSSIAADSTDLAVPAAGNSVGIGNGSQVPEPPTLALALLAVLGVVSIQIARHRLRWRTV
jgi:hypothetical protein